MVRSVINTQAGFYILAEKKNVPKDFLLEVAEEKKDKFRVIFSHEVGQLEGPN